VALPASHSRAAPHRRVLADVCCEQRRWDCGCSRVWLLEELLTAPDIFDLVFLSGEFVVGRGDCARLAFTCRRLRRVVGELMRRADGLAYAGLFRTPFHLPPALPGQLFSHQHRSLRVMLGAEDPPGWRFGDMRGGVLADDPGLGKTVTMLALIARTAGTLPQDFYGDSTVGWQHMRSNTDGWQNVLKHVINPLNVAFSRTAAGRLPAYRRTAAIEAFLCADDAVAAGELRKYQTIGQLESAIMKCVRLAIVAAVAACPQSQQLSVRKTILEPVRNGLNHIRAGLDPRQRGAFLSVTGKRALFERNLLPVATTLVIVPAPLLEHWV